jgi:L-cysteine S-thiosulfotransferase
VSRNFTSVASSVGDDLASLSGDERGHVRPHGNASWLQRLGATAFVTCSAVAGAQTAEYSVNNDGIANALTAQAGNPNRGYEIAANRQIGMCVLCHQIPNSPDNFQGDIATSLAGAGARWSVPQLRLRVVDSRRLNADSVMPAYHKVAGLSRVGATWRDKPILDAQQVEDVIAWLATLK